MSNTTYISSSINLSLGFVIISCSSSTIYASKPNIILKSSLTSLYANGNECTTPKSVIATALWPNSFALLAKFCADTTPDISLIFVCAWSSILFLAELSTLFNISFSILSTFCVLI